MSLGEKKLTDKLFYHFQGLITRKVAAQVAMNFLNGQTSLLFEGMIDHRSYTHKLVFCKWNSTML